MNQAATILTRTAGVPLIEDGKREKRRNIVEWHRIAADMGEMPRKDQESSQGSDVVESNEMCAG